MGNALRLLFNLHPGEGRKASLFIILGLLWSVGSYGSFILSEGMFLEHVGTLSLPKVYFAIAIVMCLLSTTLIFSLNRFSIRSLLVAIICLGIATNCAFFLFYPHYRSTATYWYLYKVIGWIIPISTYIVYWAFADQYYDLQDAKRFFCLFNAITFLGDALGGGLIVYFLDLLGARGLMLVFIGTMLTSLPFVFAITRRHAPIPEENHESSDGISFVDFKTIVKIACKSKFTLYLLFFYFSMQLLAVVTEFNYLNTYQKNFINAPENVLTEFNGRVGMWISLGNMFFGMLLYSRLVKKMGINNIILIAPAFFFAIFCFWFFKDALAIAIFGMIAREGMVYSFDDNNLNLLITGVPSKIKNHIRIAVESFIEPAGMFAAAAFLLVFQEQKQLLGGILALSALAIVLFLRSSYPKAIFRNLVASSMSFDRKTKDFLKKFTKKELKKSEFALLSNLKKGGEKGQLIAFEYLLKIGNARVLPRLLNHVGKLTLPGKLKAIELLNQSHWAKEPLVIERIDRWRRIFPHPAIRSAIHFYLARHGILRPERVMQDLQSEHIGLRAAAILTFKTAAHAFQFPSFYSLASEQLEQLLHSGDIEETCIALEILGLEKNASNIDQIIVFLQHPSLAINRAAGKALSLIATKEHSPYAERLIDYLADTRDSEVRIYCLNALERLTPPQSTHSLILAALNLRLNEHKYIERIVLNMEERPIASLVQIVQDKNVPDRCRLLAGKILGKLEVKTLQKRLFFIVKREIDRAYFYYYHAHTIQKQVPEHDLSILQKALHTGYQSIIDFIIQLLGIAGSLEECEILSHTLRSQNRKIRAQAVESLEKACESRLFALLEPLIDDRQEESKLKNYLKGGGIPLNLTQLLDAMTHSPSRADQIIAVAMKSQLQTPDWRQTLEEKLEGREEIFQHFAAELLETQHA